MAATDEVEVDKTRVTINVSGTRFETSYGVLERFPGTRLSLLATLRQDDEAYEIDRGEFYFERHPEVFADILHFYRTDELHIRHNLCGNVVKREFEFWGMYEQDIEACCWTAYSQAAECKETLAGIDSTFLTGRAAQNESWESETSKWIKFRRKAWAILEDPSFSVFSQPITIGHRIYVFLSMFFVVVSIVCFVAETYEGFRVPMNNVSRVAATACSMQCGVYVDPQYVPGSYGYNYDDTEPHQVLVNIDYALYVYFVLEFVARVFFTPNFRAYFCDFLNLIDVVCVLTHTVTVVLNSLESLDYSSPAVKTAMNLRLLRGLRIVRIMRIFKLVKHYNAFKILVYTIKISMRELMLMIVFLFVGAVIFGSIIHLVERDSFKNIPLGLWWALVTMTTVGYGDFVPRQAAGYAIGCVCVIFGVLTIAFTVPIVVNNFAMYYSHAQSRNKKPKDYWRIKRVPQKDLVKPTGIIAALSKFKKAPMPTSAKLYGGGEAGNGGGSGGGVGGAASKTVSVSNVGMSVMWNNLNLSEAKKSAYQTDKVTLVTPRSADSSDSNPPNEEPSAAFAAPVGPRFFARRAPMTPVQEVADQEEIRVHEENEERSRQLLAQAQEHEQQMSAAKERQADALERRKAALKNRLSSARAADAPAEAAPASDAAVAAPAAAAAPTGPKKPPSAKKPWPASRPGSKK